MTNGRKKLRILLDEGTPVSAAETFLKRGHEVIYHSDVLESGANDNMVVLAAIMNNAALVAVDADMKRIVRRFGAPNSSERYAKLNLIFLNCNEVLAVKRVAHAMSFIEHEWSVTYEKTSRRMWVDIGAHFLRTYR